MKAPLEPAEIHGRIHNAILEHRLHPGTKLAEEKLAEIFGASRAKVREVLARLAHERVVELVPQRGAFVAKPSAQEARDVFEARRLIEPAVLRRLVETWNADKAERLAAHLEAEREARRRGDRPAIVRLSGEFHALVAELAGNSAFARHVRSLSAETCLAISLYEAPTAACCHADEHARIAAAVAAGDAAAAEAQMAEHLAHVEKGLKLDRHVEEPDLEAVFSD